MGDAEEGGRDGAEGRGERRGLGGRGVSIGPSLFVLLLQRNKNSFSLFQCCQQCQFRGAGECVYVRGRLQRMLAGDREREEEAGGT